MKFKNGSSIKFGKVNKKDKLKSDNLYFCKCCTATVPAWQAWGAIGACCSFFIIGIPFIPVWVLMAIVYSMQGKRYCPKCKRFIKFEKE